MSDDDEAACTEETACDDENGDENSQLSFLHWTMNSIVMMNVARLDVFCQVGFLGSNIGHSGHFALVRKIGQKKNWSKEKLVGGKIGQKKNGSEKNGLATAGGWEEMQARCSKSG